MVQESHDESTLLARKQGRIGRVTLNRPKALNALSPSMIAALSATLDAWREDPQVHAVVVEAVGERAFSAGGDIRTLHEWVRAGRHADVDAFFRQEYGLNRTIARYPKPYLALVDGLCMGGGVGIAVHGTVRVATEHAQFAMPETQIGFFPDVGASFVLPRLRGSFGMYLGLTAGRAAGPDAVWLGLATHFVPRARLAGLADALAEHGMGALAEAALPPPPGELQAIEAAVEACFGAPSVPEILDRLARLDTEWSRATLATMRAVSPSSLLWSFTLLRDGADRTLEHCQDAEFELTRRVTRHPDFAEGVRAMVIDKDRAPRWSPPRLEEVDPDAIAAMFRPG